jgi:acyl transferase domain-containing protein
METMWNALFVIRALIRTVAPPALPCPVPLSQSALVHSVYREIGMDSMIDRPQYFEAHGTGTPAGDPIGARAICSAFFKYGPLSPDAKLYVGSIKTLVGHTEGTAGLAGLIKTAMCLKHGMIVPNLLFSGLNPEIKPFYDSLKIPTVLREWPQIPDGRPRRASVNSFDFGGRNAHAILESHEQGAVGGKSVEYPIYIPFCCQQHRTVPLCLVQGRFRSI